MYETSEILGGFDLIRNVTVKYFELLSDMDRENEYEWRTYLYCSNQIAPHITLENFVKDGFIIVQTTDTFSINSKMLWLRKAKA